MMSYYLTLSADHYFYSKACESEVYPTTYMCNSCACAPAEYHNEVGNFWVWSDSAHNQLVLG